MMLNYLISIEVVWFCHLVFGIAFDESVFVFICLAKFVVVSFTFNRVGPFLRGNEWMDDEIFMVELKHDDMMMMIHKKRASQNTYLNALGWNKLYNIRWCGQHSARWRGILLMVLLLLLMVVVVQRRC